MYKTIVADKGSIMANIMINWINIVQQPYCDITYPLKIIEYKTTKNHKCLIIEVPDHAIAMEIQYQKNSIIDKVNLFLGYKLVDIIKVDVNESLWK